MTLKELNRLYYTKKLLERDKEKLLALQDKAEYVSPVLRHTPHSHTIQNRTEEITVEICTVKERIALREKEILRIESELERDINAFGDAQIQLILLYRFVDMLTWQEVADELGGRNTEKSVTCRFYKFLKKTQAG